MAAQTKQVALIFGVTGLVGKEIAKKLISRSQWKVYGVARKPDPYPINDPKYQFISCDLLDPNQSQQKLSSLEDVTHVFWITWASQFPLDSQECCDQNKVMLFNALSALIPIAKGLRHVSLQTGMKHYVNLEASLDNKDSVYDEECPRADSESNFYFVLEDMLKERLQGKVAWSVHRPGLILGSSRRTLYNFMGSLCVYAAICKHLNLPFVFGGTKERWEESCIDGSDARLVAEQHIWASCEEKTFSINGQAFNAINGPRFTWKEIWPALGNKFEVDVPENPFHEDFWYSKSMKGMESIWKEITVKEDLIHTNIEDLANWDFLDILFRCPVKLLGSRDKADRLGFTMRCKTLDSILYWVDFMRDEKLVP